MLRIEGFTLQGSEGSGNFGHPVPVETTLVVKELLLQLEMDSRNDWLDQNSTSGSISPIQSQAGNSADDSSSLEESTQAAFSTQAPTKASNGPAVSGLADSAASKRPLIAVLGSKRTNAQQAPTRDHEPARTYVSLYIQKPRDNLVDGSSDSASSSSKSGQHITMPLTSTIPPIEPRAGSRKKRGHLQGNILLLPQPASESDISKSQKVQRTEDGDINNGLLSNDISTASRIENSAGVREDGNRSLGYPGTVSKSHQRAEYISRPIQDADNPWEGLIRIPRKYAQIPKDQRNILERDDAWYPHVPSNRQPGINLPPTVLINLQAFHDKLGDRVSDGQSDSQSNSQSDSDCESHSDNHSDSHSEHSEKQKGGPAKSSRSVKKAARKSIRGNNLPSSGVASSGQDSAMAHLASSEPVSTDQGDSSMEGSLDAAEMDSECETGVRNTEGSYIQVEKILPSGKILLDHEVDVSSASQDRGDGSSAEEAISWPSSPNRVEVYSSRNHSLQEDPQGPAIDDRIDAPKSFQSQAPPSKISPIALIDTENPSTEEDEADSEIESLLVLQDHAKRQPTVATGRMTQASKTGFESSSVLFSSSPVEMELSVPFALGNQTQPSYDVVMTDASGEGQPTPATGERPRSRFDLERTPLPFSHSRSPRAKTRNVKSDEKSRLRQQRANISSDPIIPGTFRSEASNTFTRPVERISATSQIRLEGHAFAADQVISTTPSPLSRLHSYAISPVDGEKYKAQRQQHGESEASTQKSRHIGSSYDTSISVDTASKASVFRQGFWDTNDTEVHASPTNHEPSQPSIPGTQMSSFEGLPSFAHAPIGDEIIFSTTATPIKRRVSGMRDMIEPSPKRRRTLQAVIVDSAQEKDSGIDPTEMAKANRRKFLQELSLEHSSPIRSPHKPHENSPAQSNMASDAVAEIVSQSPLAKAPIGTRSDDVSPTGPPCCKTEIPSGHLQELSAEELRDTSLDDTGQNTNEINEKASNGRRIDNGNIEKEITGLHQGTTATDPECASAESREHEGDEIGPAATKVQSGDDHTLQNETIFDVFNTAYPSYGESQRAFIRACVCLDSLHSMKKAPHPSLWDDFLRAFSAEYSDHVDECKLLNQKPMLAPDFYNNHVLKPVFMERIMTLARLQEVFLLDPEETTKNRAIIRQKKRQKKQELVATACSQLTVTSKTSESQDAQANLLGSSSSQQSNSSVITIQGPSDHVGDVEMVSGHLHGVVSAPGVKIPVQKPFFETSSQLVIQGRHNIVEPPGLSTSMPAQEARNNAVMEDPPEHFGSPDIEMVQANVVKQTPRRLLWSSSPQEIPESEELQEVNKATPGGPNATSQSQTYRQPQPVSSVRPREGSPILGSVTLNSISTEKQALQSELSATLSSNLGFRQDLIFKTPSLPASKPLGRRTTSMPGPGETGLDDLRTSHYDERSSSLQIAKNQKTIISATTATFKEFSKVFVPRQKRRSSVFSRVSTPGSDLVRAG
jgi:hypothetical protein